MSTELVLAAVRCEGFTARGSRCTNQTRLGEYCHHHQDMTADDQPYKMTITVRMMNGEVRTYVVSRARSVYILWRALAKIWDWS